MKGYKGFEPGMICRGKQYAENTVFEEDTAELCEAGMHFCENPMDVLDYYPLVNDSGTFSEFAEVEAPDTAQGDGKKFCTTKLKIGAKLSFGGFINACVNFPLEKTKGHSASGDYARIGSSGNSAQIVSTGEDSVICCAGNNCIASAKPGSWITLAEWEYNSEEGRYVPVCVKTEYVDGERIKADTPYMLRGGEFVAVE